MANCVHTNSPPRILGPFIANNIQSLMIRRGVAYAFEIGKRYLRSKKRSTISVITVIAVLGVSMGVASLLAVLSITGGFQQEFRNKVLGVNAHVLVLRYGTGFDEYRSVMDTAKAMPEVDGAGPFLINEMMLAKEDRLSSVLVKGVDPELMKTVLDLPEQIIDGSLDGLRKEGARPPIRPENLGAAQGDDWEWLEELTNDDDDGVGDDDEDTSPTSLEDIDAILEKEEKAGTLPLPETQPLRKASEKESPTFEVASPEEVEAALAELELDELDLPGDEWDAELLEDDAERERQEADKSLPGIVVGVMLAKSLSIGVGDRVKLISPLSGVDLSMVAGAQRAPKSREFRVIGIFEAGFQEYDSRLVYTDLYEAQHFFNQGDSVTGVEMSVHDLDTSESVARKLERDLGGPYHTMDWAELNRNLFTALKFQKIVLSIVIATIIFVAAFNVIATLIMIVLEKKREIAILKAMGATDWTVLGVFMVQGVLIGIVGTLLGLLLGAGVVFYLKSYQFPLDPKVYLIDHVPVVVTWSEFALTAGIAFVICALATVMPSWWAARMLPVDGLRRS